MTRHPEGTSAYAVWGRDICSRAEEVRRPIAGSISITNHCNLRCVHCYLEDCRDCQELSAKSWMDIIDQLEQAGCLWLLITGGEPLIRSDFIEIYQHAKKKGFLITVFTNATLVNEAVVELWREWPPHSVEISVYGFTRRAYREVTGLKQARDKCFDAIHHLARAGVPVRLKTVAIRQNASEIARLKQFSQELGFPFRYDPVISPTLKGSKKPCAAQLCAEEIVRFDIEDQQRNQGWMDFIDSRKSLPLRKSLFSCLAGKISFHIYPDGLLSLCVFDLPVFDLKRGTFLEGWQGQVKKRRDLPLPESHPCWGCQDLIFCPLCAAMAKTVTGDELGWSKAMCGLGKERSRLVRSSMPKKEAKVIFGGS